MIWNFFTQLYIIQKRERHFNGFFKYVVPRRVLRRPLLWVWSGFQFVATGCAGFWTWIWPTCHYCIKGNRRRFGVFTIISHFFLMFLLWNYTTKEQKSFFLCDIILTAALNYLKWENYLVIERFEKTQSCYRRIVWLYLIISWGWRLKS